MTVTTEQAAALAASTFGIEGQASELPGEVDTNFKIRTEDGTYVLKLSPPETTGSLLAARQFAMTRLGSAGVPYRFPMPPDGGEDVVPLPEGGSASLLTWIEGTPFGEAGRPIELAQDIGLLAGTVVRSLEGFDHPALHYDTHWNLAAATSVLRQLIRHVPSRGDRALIEDALDHLVVQLPKLRKLPKQVIHGDINDLNVLVRDNEVVGLIDFGDLIHSWRIAEVAIAATYAMLGQDDPLAVATDVVTGYAEIADVTTAEAEMIYDLIRARLAVSACVAASRADQGNPHHLVSEDDVWELLDRLDYVDAVAARTELARAAGKGFSPSQSTLRDRRTLALGGALSLSYETSPSGPLHIVRGERAYLYDTMGRRYLDCVNNVAHVGHSHPDVVGAAADQMIMLNTNTRYLHDNVVNYAERLLDALPEHLEIVYLVNSGSEANELALRMARAATEQTGMAVLDHGYHGNTAATIEMSPYKFDGPGGRGRPDWVTVLPLADPYRPNPAHSNYRATVDWLLDEREPVAGVIAESIVGCGGQVIPGSDHMQAIYDAVHARGGVCIADEVQTGFGRVGSHFWAFQLHDLVPDIVTLGKPIGNGHPMGAVAATFDVAAAFANGMEYFNTFGGNPVSAAIGLAVLDVIDEEGLQQNAADVGGYLKERLEGLAERHQAIGDVRGVGLFQGIEFVTDRESKQPDAECTRQVVHYAKEHGVLLSIDGPHHNVIKIKPPMVFNRDDTDKLVAIIDAALAVATG